jgi:predicted AlkP superfamily pyrophosphatase or phosphodiesterase
MKKPEQFDHSGISAGRNFLAKLWLVGNFCLFIAALIAGSFMACGADLLNSDSDRTVVVISVDGLAAYYLDDPKAEMPTLRALAAEGARASGMRASTPTVTWPNHTTLVTGVTPAKHGVLGNNYFDRQSRKKVTLISDPVFDKDEIVKVPTIYDLAKAAGMKTAGIRWPATRNAKTLDWTIPDVLTTNLLRKYTTPALFADCEKAGIDIFADDATEASSDSPPPKPTDEICTRVFKLMLREHHPQLAVLHVIDVDHTEHLKGPKSPEAYAAVKAADDEVRQVWEELKRDFPGRATLFVVSDHGFSPIERMILPNVVLRKAGIVEAAAGKKGAGTGGAVQMVTQGGSAFVYVLDDPHRSEIIDRIRKALQGVEGISRIIGPEGFKEYGVANPKDDPHAPDMILFAQEGCVFGDTAAGELPFVDKPERKGSHGHDSSLPDLHATFVAWGVGIKRGVQLGEISNTDVAPTIATLLGFSIPNVEGTALKKALAEK